MSKLIEELNRVRKGAPRPLGFGTGSAASEGKKMLLVVSLGEERLEALADSAREADAAIVTVSGDAEKALARVKDGLGEAIWGVQPGGKARAELSVLAKAGADFVVFSPEMPLVSDSEEVGKVLEVDPSLSDGMLRAISGLPVDVVLVGIEREGNLTWHDLMVVQRLTGLLAKPVMVSLPAEVSAGELQALGEAGVKGVVVPLKAGQSEDRIKELRQTIGGLVFHPKEKREERVLPLLPLVSGERNTVTEDEEEEEE
ncbi:MAG: hypothetical protein V1849_02730 [Chloroflexota bacterium]